MLLSKYPPEYAMSVDGVDYGLSWLCLLVPAAIGFGAMFVKESTSRRWLRYAAVGVASTCALVVFVWIWTLFVLAEYVS